MFTSILGKILDNQDLTREEIKTALELIMKGECTNAQIGAFLAALRCKGETIEEITGAVEVLRSKSTPVPTSVKGLVDTCGTGGDNSGSYNISTTSALIAAAAGVPVAKHGNKAMSSSCGSANVLQELGLNTNLTPEQVGQSVDQHSIGFLFAMNLHPAMKYVGPVRMEMGQRTIFNLLGPMLNPAGAKRQIFGVYHPQLTEKLANVLQKTGSEHVLVVAGLDGLDELSLTSPTKVTELKNNTLTTYEVTPEQFGFKTCSREDLLGGSPQKNAQIIKNILAGEKGPKRDIAVLNAGAALYVGGKAKDIQEGVRLAEQAIDSNKALETLEAFVSFSNQF